MEVSVTQFRTNCLKFIEDVAVLHTEIIITKHGKPLAKLVAIPQPAPGQVLGSLTGVGETVGDLTAPFDRENYKDWIYKGLETRQQEGNRILCTPNPCSSRNMLEEPKSFLMPNMKKFAVCLHNEGYPASWERYKIYQVIPDAQAEKYEQMRIIDESGEDYLYPAEYFVLLELPEVVEKPLLQAV